MTSIEDIGEVIEAEAELSEPSMKVYRVKELFMFKTHASCNATIDVADTTDDIFTCSQCNTSQFAINASAKIKAKLILHHPKCHSHYDRGL